VTEGRGMLEGGQQLEALMGGVDYEALMTILEGVAECLQSWRRKEGHRKRMEGYFTKDG
jgi:hypothetical protein